MHMVTDFCMCRTAASPSTRIAPSFWERTDLSSPNATERPLATSSASRCAICVCMSVYIFACMRRGVSLCSQFHEKVCNMCIHVRAFALLEWLCLLLNSMKIYGQYLQAYVHTYVSYIHIHLHACTYRAFCLMPWSTTSPSLAGTMVPTRTCTLVKSLSR